MNNFNLNKFCRTCLSEDSEKIPLNQEWFYENETNKMFSIAEMLRLCTNINVNENNEELPNEICEKCVEFLENSFKFYQKTHRAHKYLIEILAEKNENDFNNFIEIVDGEDNDEDNINFDLIESNETSICDICKLTFSTNLELKNHMSKHRPKKFICNTCEKSFSRKRQLENHERTHTNEKPFTCEICSISFNQETTLMNHKRRHTKEKPFICDFCSKAFAHKCSLQQHLVVHTGEKPFDCDICSMKFTHRGLLKDHKRTHNGDLFKCDICTKTFLNKFNFTRHKLMHEKKLQVNNLDL